MTVTVKTEKDESRVQLDATAVPGEKVRICQKHSGPRGEAQGQAVVYLVEDEENKDGTDCPWCFDNHVRDDYEQAFARLWVLLNSDPEERRPIGGRLADRIQVAFELVEKITNQWSIDGSMAADEDYKADETRVKNLNSKFKEVDVEALLGEIDVVVKRFKGDMRSAMKVAVDED